MAKQINCGICAIHGDTVAMELKHDFFYCPVCEAELWPSNETKTSLAKMINQECGLRNDQYEKLNNITNRANGSFESNFK